MKTTTTEVDERGSGRLLVAEPQGTFSASGGQPQTHERHTAEVVGNCEYWEGARPARKSSRRTNHKGRTIQRVGGGVTNGGGTVRAVGGIEPGSDPWLVANPTTLPRGQSHIHTYIHTYIHHLHHLSDLRSVLNMSTTMTLLMSTRACGLNSVMFARACRR